MRYQVCCCMSCKHELLLLLRILAFTNSDAYNYWNEYLAQSFRREKIVRYVDDLRSPSTTVRLSAGKSEVHRHLSVNFDRLTVQNIRTIFPLFHRIERGLLQQRMSTQNVQVLNRTVFADNRS